MNSPFQESHMMPPVLRLFPKRTYRRLQQVRMGRKLVDLLCVSRPYRDANQVIAIELKIKDWRTALWQAYINRQIAHQSYIAVWHEYSHRVEREVALLEQHRVGLIVAYPRSARIVLTPLPGAASFSSDIRQRLAGIVADDV